MHVCKEHKKERMCVCVCASVRVCMCVSVNVCVHAHVCMRACVRMCVHNACTINHCTQIRSVSVIKKNNLFTCSQLTMSVHTFITDSLIHESVFSPSVQLPILTKCALLATRSGGGSYSM